MINFFKKKRDYSRKTDSPEERVKAFIAHYHEQWLTAQKKLPKTGLATADFEYWQGLVTEVEGAHFVPGCSSGAGMSISSRPDYDQKKTRINDCEAQGESARVFAENVTNPGHRSDHFAFELERNDDQNWLISNIILMTQPPMDLVIDPDSGPGILAMSSSTAPLLEIEDTLRLDENILFQDDRTVDIPDVGPCLTKLHEVGKLRIESGVLGILDFAYNIYDFEPLQRRVEPGEYPVQAVEVKDRIAGIRVRFDENEPAVKWYAAKTPSGNGIYGVDAGNLAIMDVGSLLKLNYVTKETLYDRWTRSCQPMLLSMTTDNDCVITSSGVGDGAYPAFWGVDASGQVVSLFIDFMLLVEEADDGFMVSI